MLSSRSLIGNMSACFSLLGSLELAGSLKQTLDRTYSKPNAYDCAEREIERAGIQQDLERFTHSHLFLSARDDSPAAPESQSQARALPLGCVVYASARNRDHHQRQAGHEEINADEQAERPSWVLGSLHFS
jgi:hypothetical protein